MSKPTGSQKAVPGHLPALRTTIKAAGVQAFIVPRSDEYLGEYVPPANERLLWATGFSGSWGFALVGLKQSALVIDGRYTIQAAQETSGTNITLLTPEAAELQSFMAKNLPKASRIGCDPWTVSTTEWERLERLTTAAGCSLVATHNLVDASWSDRPPQPAAPVSSHPLRFAGVSVTEKLDLLAKTLKSLKAHAAILCDAHATAWALNVRGADVAHTPLALLRAIVFDSGKAILIADKSRLSSDAILSFGPRVRVVAPAMFEAELKKLASAGKALLIDPQQTPEAVRQVLTKAKATIRLHQDICTLPRARKNPTEQKGTRIAHLRDGAAMAEFLCWLEANAQSGMMSEREAQEKLADFRKATGKLKDLSFGTISASGPNAAMPHYHVGKGPGRRLRPGSIYLVDSGAQYEDGTTDITRTIAIGKPTQEMRQKFTLVLKGMIAVSRSRFPAGTTGVQIDALARNALWQAGLDYDHGTGHGVGSYLSVHEGPARISKAGNVALEPGMILSNEPGYYREGSFGIRIENLLLVSPPAKIKGGERTMLSFETLSFAPIDKHLIDSSLLSRDELHWLDTYHAIVLKKLQSRVKPETRAWLKEACKPFT